MDNKTFNDPLDKIIKQHQNAMNPSSVDNVNNTGIGTGNIQNLPDNVTPPPAPSNLILPEIPKMTPHYEDEEEDIRVTPTQIGSFSSDEVESEEDIYGDNDLDNDIVEEDRRREAERKNAYEESKRILDEKNIKTVMPPNPYDPQHHIDAISFQTDKVAVVTTMINRVIAKYHIVEGGVPEDVKLKVMGELMDCYHNDGEVITPKFETILLNNWIMSDGRTAREYIDNPTTTTTTNTNENVNQNDDVDNEENTRERNTEININVPNGTPVTVNVDESIVNELKTNKKIDILVHEVDELELKATTIIENSQQEGIIGVYDTGVNDVPITLPGSGYRCVMRAINWFDFIRLVSPSSQNREDDELRKWSVLYKHLKNPSIGPFKDFDDFLKKTKSKDRELMMWALLVATADEDEPLHVTCGNKKCGYSMDIKYRPREIIHLDEELIPDYYVEVHDVQPGPKALELYNRIASKRRRYKLPHTGIIVELEEPSAYEFITNRFRLVRQIYERFVSDGDMSKLRPGEPEFAEFDYLTANAMYVSAMSIVKDDKEYRYTNWDDIEKIITESLDSVDSGALLKLIQQSQANTSPVKFWVDGFDCPKCHNKIERIMIEDISQTLLFQVSQRLDSMEINLTEMQ